MGTNMDGHTPPQPDDTAADMMQEAVRLERSGAWDAARQRYWSVLQANPGHYRALMNLADLLRKTGYRSAARLTWQEAARLYPGLGEPWLALGHLEREEEAWQLSRTAYENAIARNPALWTAHQGLAYVLDALGEAQGAAHHRDLGFTAQPHITIPGAGTGTPIRVLLLASATGGDTPWLGLLDSGQYQVEIVASEYWPPARRLPPHDVIVNAVSDADAAWSAMDAAESLAGVSGRPIVNPPALLRETGRHTVAERLKRVPGVETARIIRCSKTALGDDGLETITGAGFQFPVLVRAVGHHTGRYFERADDVGRLSEAASRMSGEELWIVEWLETPHHGDTPYRKYRVMMIDGRLYPVHAAWSRDWKVHYFSRTASPASQMLHERFLQDMPGQVGPRAMEALEAIQQELHLDYGGIDFDVLPDGTVRVFEANATMVVPPQPIILSAVSDLIRSRI